MSTNEQTQTDIVHIVDDNLRRGFAQVPRPVLKAKGLSLKAKAVYIALLDYAWQSGSCYPAQQQVAQDLDVSLDTVQRALQELKTYKLVSWKRQGLNKPNIYFILRLSDNPNLDLSDPRKPQIAVSGNRSSAVSRDRNERYKEYTEKNTQENISSNRFDVHSSQKGERGTTPVPGRGDSAMPNGRESARPPANAAGAAPAPVAPQPVDEDRELFRELLQPYRSSFHDHASAKATVSRALNLYRKSGTDRSRFIGLLYEASSRTKESQQLGTIEGHAFAYFLKAVEGLVFPEERISAPALLPESPENGPGRTSETQQVLASSLPIPAPEEVTAGQIVVSAESSDTSTAIPEDTDPVWHAVKEELKSMFTSGNFFTWIAPTRVISHSGNRMTVGVEKPFHKHWIDTKLRPRIQQCLNKLGFNDVAVEFVVLPSG